MAAGVPIIISLIPGVTDSVNLEGETGFFIPVGDVHSLRAAMEALGQGRMLRVLMGKNAIKRARAVFGWKDHIDRWERLYLQVLS
jgi:glycosyltransferase involved in cell wall biosynthesis